MGQAGVPERRTRLPDRIFALCMVRCELLSIVHEQKPLSSGFSTAVIRVATVITQDSKVVILAFRHFG